VGERCADLSEAAGESLAATAVTARRWLLVEMRGSWPRDVTMPDALPDEAGDAVAAWLDETPGSRLHFVRRPARTGRRPLAFVVRAEEAQREVRRIELDRLDDLAALDLDASGAAVDSSLVLVCGHGSRDRCCALRGTAVFGALAERLEEEALWISSHQGGHRFAANVLVLPSGLQFGRVSVDEAPRLVARALAGRIELERYRGRTCYPASVQAAEHAVRVAAGLDGVDDLRLAAAENGTVGFRSPDGMEWAAVVEPMEGPAVPASCGAEAAPQPSLAGRLL
jgi:hypothetical protein